MSISKIKEINKELKLAHYHGLNCNSLYGKDCDCSVKEIQKLYTQQILSLIEELEAETIHIILEDFDSISFDHNVILDKITQKVEVNFNKFIVEVKKSLTK